MRTRIREYDNRDDVYEQVDTHIFHGYKVVRSTKRYTKMRRSNYGSMIGHVIWFLLTFWWTLGLGNLFYMAYSYTMNSDEIVLRIKEGGNNVL